MAQTQDDFIGCWNEILVPKWNRFRHLLSGNGKIHSDIAIPLFGIQPGDKILDIGCGYGETCLQLGRLVGSQGKVVGIDCTKAFLEIAEEERKQSGLNNIEFILGDAQSYNLPSEKFDICFSRFGVMFFESAVRALKNAHGALKPGGKVCLVVWRRLKENPCWVLAKEVALKYLPPPGEDAQTCGPGPFSWGDEETDRGMLKAAGFKEVDFIKPVDAEVCVGTSLDEAMDYQILVGPSGEIIREAGEEGKEKLPLIREELRALFQKYLRGDEVWMPSATWAIQARKT